MSGEDEREGIVIGFSCQGETSSAVSWFLVSGWDKRRVTGCQEEHPHTAVSVHYTGVGHSQHHTCSRYAPLSLSWRYTLLSVCCFISTLFSVMAPACITHRSRYTLMSLFATVHHSISNQGYSEDRTCLLLASVMEIWLDCFRFISKFMMHRGRVSASEGDLLLVNFVNKQKKKQQ